MYFSSRTLAAALLCSLLSPVAASPVWAAVPAVARQTTAAPATAKTMTAQQPATQSVQTYDLHFHPENEVKESLPLDNQQVAYYAYRNLVYVAHPRNPEYEQMNLFVPAAGRGYGKDHFQRDQCRRGSFRSFGSHRQQPGL